MDNEFPGKPKVTPKEAAAIENLRAAIKALPFGIYFDVDQFDGVVSFNKRVHDGLAYEVAKPLRCKRASML